MNANSLAKLEIPAPTGSQPKGSGHHSLGVLFKALGDPLRLQIVRLLKGDSLSVSELCEVLDMRQSALSHHLKVLVEVDLLVRRREGTAVFYRRGLATGPRAPLVTTLFDNIDREPLNQSLTLGMRRVQQQREQNSLAFFRTHSARFREQQELIASWADYAQATLHLLDHCPDLPDLPIIEIGAGDGRLLPMLAERQSRVVALDNAPEMLEDAKATAGHLDGVAFWLGDTSVLQEQRGAFSVAIMNMVLHHTPHPERVLAEAALGLAPGGALIISELLAHDQAWAREHCGDLWLGFEPGQLTAWGQAAGLVNRTELFITQRNGFQIQVRLLQRELG